MHGPPATHPAQQNGRPTWNVGVSVISMLQVVQVKGREVLMEHGSSLVGVIRRWLRIAIEALRALPRST